jgi:hypothetical protein
LPLIWRNPQSLKCTTRTSGARLHCSAGQEVDEQSIVVVVVVGTVISTIQDERKERRKTERKRRKPDKWKEGTRF